MAKTEEGWFSATDAPLAHTPARKSSKGKSKSTRRDDDDDVSFRLDRLEGILLQLTEVWATCHNMGKARTLSLGASPRRQVSGARHKGRERHLPARAHIGVPPGLAPLAAGARKPSQAGAVQPRERARRRGRRGGKGGRRELVAAGQRSRRRSDVSSRQAQRTPWAGGRRTPQDKDEEKQISGLDKMQTEGGSSGSGSDSDVSPAGGARGMLQAKRLLKSMSEEPKAFNAEMRSRLMAKLATATDTEHLLVENVTRLPLEKQRYMCYFVWTLAQLNGELEAERVEAAQLLTMRMVASIDQAILDGHWRTAWPLTGLAEPPWPTRESSSLSAHRRAFASSSLLSEAWVSTTIGRTRDEQFFEKKRHDEKDGGAAATPGDAAGSKAGGRGKA